MKKVCFVTTISMTLSAFVLDTAKYLHEQGNYEITFVCDFDSMFKEKLPEYITYIPISMKRGVDLLGFKAIYEMYKLFKNNGYDIVQYSTPNASFYASVAAKLAGVPVRLYCQWGIVYVGFKGIKKTIFKIVEKIVCSLSSWIEPDSVGNLNFSYIEGLYSKSKSSVIWNGSASGVNLTKFNLSKKYTWSKYIKDMYNISDKDIIFGFIGRIVRDKGVNELLEATKHLIEDHKNVKLMLVGSIETIFGIDDNLLKWAYESQNIIFVGWTNEVEKYIAAMDIFMLPSYREGFGSVIIEAGAMKVPSIVTNIPGPSDVVIDMKTGIVVKKGDTLELYNAMKTFYEDRSEITRMGENAYGFTVGNFNQEELLRHILDDRNRLIEHQIYGNEEVI